MLVESVSNKKRYLENLYFIEFSKETGFYPDILGVAKKIPDKTDLTVQLGLVKSFILNCPNVKRHIKAENPKNLDYLEGYKEYLRERALKQGNWFDAQGILAEELDYCGRVCPLLQQQNLK